MWDAETSCSGDFIWWFSCSLQEAELTWYIFLISDNVASVKQESFMKFTAYHSPYSIDLMLLLWLNWHNVSS